MHRGGRAGRSGATTRVGGMLRVKLQWKAEFHGANPLAREPVICADMRLDPAEEAGLDAPAAARRLGAQFPDWSLPGADAVEGGSSGAVLVARLAVAWARAALNEVRGDLRAGGATMIQDGVRLWLGFHIPQISRNALILALEVAKAAMAEDFERGKFEAPLDRLWKSCRAHHPDFQARMLMQAARAADIPFLPMIEGTRVWQFGWGRRSRAFFETSSNADGYLAGEWQRSKPLGKAVLMALGVPTPDHAVVKHEEQLADAAAKIGLPCVVKPLASGGGRGVTSGVRSQAELESAFRFACEEDGGPAMVEAMVAGEDYRLMVIGGEMVAAVRREATWVIGDGVRTVEELVAERNAARSKNLDRSGYLYPIPLDKTLDEHLATQGVSLAEVLPTGQRITLRSNANRSTGGICTDVTALAHPQVKAMAEQLAKTVGLHAAGIDYLTTDISRPPADTGGAVIELNATPGLSACVAAGLDGVALARRILGKGLGRIPVDVTIIPAARQAEVIDALIAQPTGNWVCGDRLRVGGMVLTCRSATPWAAVHSALRNRELDELHVVCTSRDVVAHGLPVDTIRRTTVSAADLPEAWCETLARCSHEIVARNDIVQDAQPHD